jgi:hypothetical protein
MPTPPQLTHANAQRIKTDGSMGKEDVDAILGIQGVERTTPGEQAAVVFDKLGQAFGEKTARPRRQQFRWGDDNKHVDCVLVNGRVVEKRVVGLN